VHYQHQYHAGNFADVVKHLAVHRALTLISRKSSPWCVVDTHAGAGAYALGHPASARTGEWRDGIGRLVDATRGMPDVVRAWMSAIERCNGEALRSGVAPRLYPGSPWLAADAARENDRVLLFETEADVVATLRDEIRPLPHAAQCAIHARDGYESASLMPPKERRGLVLIDPPFERRDEFDAIGDYLQRLLGRFANASVLIWYPAKTAFDTQRFLRRVRAAHPVPDMFAATLDTGLPADGRMVACGILAINPPYPLAADLQQALNWLAPILASGPGASAQVDALTPTRGPAPHPKTTRKK